MVKDDAQRAPRKLVSGEQRPRKPGVTHLLHDWSAGAPGALNDLIPLVYDELRRMAHGQLWKEHKDHSLGGTALVHETFMRLAKQRNVQLDSRAQFFRWASQVMRHILINHSRDRQAAKRGGKEISHSLEALQEESGELPDGGDSMLDLLALDEALQLLERLDPRKSQIIELRFFGGLSVNDTAEALQVSPSTVVREWTAARAWLLHELGNGSTLE